MAEKKGATAAPKGSRLFGGTSDPEVLDTTPVEMPFGSCKPTPIHEMIARYVQDAVESQNEEDFESWDEANDFEEEDPEVLDLSPYQFDDLDPEPVPDLTLEPPAVEKPPEDPPAPDLSGATREELEAALAALEPSGRPEPGES